MRSADPAAARPGEARVSRLWHLGLVVAVSAFWEAQFHDHWLNLLDEGWPIHAAMRLEAGGTLYRDVFWVFPPGHLLAGWLGYVFDPPGVLLARLVYAGFTVSLCAGIYLLGRRVMPPGYALLGALLLATAAPLSHQYQVLFGYRYLVFGVLALLCFDRFLRGTDPRWMLLAGVLTGITLVFRLTPAFAVACGIGAGIVTARRDPREWVRAGAWYAAGLLIVATPVLLYFFASIGPEKLWLEVVTRPVRMTKLQELSLPEIRLPDLSRWSIWWLFVAVQFRLYMAFFLGLGVILIWRLGRTSGSGKDFPHPLLTAIVVWGAVYFMRSMGRSDFAHLDSALPPICLLLALSLHAVVRRLPRVGRDARIHVAVGVVVFLLWGFFNRTDLYLFTPMMGSTPVAALAGRSSIDPSDRVIGPIDALVDAIRANSRPEDTILGLHILPLLHPLTGRLGPGYHDLVMPGTFLSKKEELSFVERLAGDPPRLVIACVDPFDYVASRSVERAAPWVHAWVMQNYRRIGEVEPYVIYEYAGRKSSQARPMSFVPDPP